MRNNMERVLERDARLGDLEDKSCMSRGHCADLSCIKVASALSDIVGYHAASSQLGCLFTCSNASRWRFSFWIQCAKAQEKDVVEEHKGESVPSSPNHLLSQHSFLYVQFMLLLFLVVAILITIIVGKSFASGRRSLIAHNYFPSFSGCHWEEQEQVKIFVSSGYMVLNLKN